MKLPVGKGGSSFGKRPKVNKGYYPGQLLRIKQYKDQDGNEKVMNFGKMLIFDIGVYECDKDKTPIKPLTYKDSESGEEKELILGKFLYYMYTNKDPKTKLTMPFVPAIKVNAKNEPTTAIAKAFAALGWEPSMENLPDPDDYIGKWIEVNVDDYEVKSDDGNYAGSTINKITGYEGKDIPKDLKLIAITADQEVAQEEKSSSTPKTPIEVKRDELTQRYVKKEIGPHELNDGLQKLEDEEKKSKPVDAEKEQKKKDLQKMLDDKLLTQEGYDKSMEQLEAQ